MLALLGPVLGLSVAFLRKNPSFLDSTGSDEVLALEEFTLWGLLSEDSSVTVEDF